MLPLDPWNQLGNRAAGAAGEVLQLAGDIGVFLSVFCPDSRTFLLLDIMLTKFPEEHAGLQSFRDRPGWLLEMPT